MATTANGSFQIVAVIDGSSIDGYLRVDRMALMQRYNDAGQYVPDYESVAENQRPAVVPILRDLANGGEPMVPQTLTWKYNGVELTFSDDGLSTNDGMEGVFKRNASYSMSYNGQTYVTEALEVMKNLVPISGYDNDRISASGTIEVGGTQMEFSDLSTDVIILKSTGDTTSAYITFENDVSDLDTNVSQVTAKVQVWGASGEISDLSGYAFDWKKEGTEGDVALSTGTGTGQTQVVTRDDVDSYAVIKCTVKKDGSTVAVALAEVRDNADPVKVECVITGMTGGKLHKGGTAVVTPKATTSNGTKELTVQSASWHIYNNNMQDFRPSGYDGPTFTAATASLTYEDVKNAGWGIKGFVQVTVTL